MLPVNIVLPADKDEMALTLNGKKRNLRRKDFLVFAEHCDLTHKTAEKMISRLLSRELQFRKQVRESFLPESKKEEMENFVVSRMQRLSGSGQGDGSSVRSGSGTCAVFTHLGTCLPDLKTTPPGLFNF